MTDDQQQSHGESLIPEPPQANVVTEEQRNRRSKKGILIGAGLLSALLIVVWKVLFGGSDPVPTLDGQAVAAGEASIETGVQEGGSGGGLRQELIETQSQIEEEERRQERLQNGRSIISLGETDLEEESESEPETPNTTFGTIAPVPPRASAEPGGIRDPGRRPITRSGSQQAPMNVSAAVQAEIQKLQSIDAASAGGMNQEVFYAATTVGNTGYGLPGDSELDDEMSGAEGAVAFTAGELGMPGETLTAYMENRITSEQPNGRVVATILDGELKGARAIGSARFEGERLLIEFNRVVLPDGGYIRDVSLLAVDPNSFETSLQSGIDRRLLTRYGVPLLYGITALGLDYAANRDSISVTETDPATGEYTHRTIQTDPSFGEYALQNGMDTLKNPLSEAADRAANVQPLAWADPGVIGLLIDTPIPSN